MSTEKVMITQKNKRGRGRPTNASRGMPNIRKKAIALPKKTGRPTGTGNAPVIKPQGGHIKNGEWTTYITYSPYKTKSGQVVFHRHSRTIKTTNREEKKEHTERKCNEVRKAKKVLSVTNVHKLTIEQLKQINTILYPT